jgi:hypothetical protein
MEATWGMSRLLERGVRLPELAWQKQIQCDDVAEGGLTRRLRHRRGVDARRHRGRVMASLDAGPSMNRG